MENPSLLSSNPHNRPPLQDFPTQSPISNLPNPYHRPQPNEQPPLINGITRLNAILSMIVTASVLMVGLIVYSLILIGGNQTSYQYVENYQGSNYQVKKLSGNNSTIVDGYDVFHNGSDILATNKATYLQAVKFETASSDIEDYLIETQLNQISAKLNARNNLQFELENIASDLNCDQLTDLAIQEATTSDSNFVLTAEGVCNNQHLLKAIQKFYPASAELSTSIIIATTDNWNSSGEKFKELINSLSPKD